MGERLCVSIRHDDGREPLVVTYHWSAYTVTAFTALAELARILSDERAMGTPRPELLSDDVLTFRVAEALHACGGGIDGSASNIDAFRELRKRLGGVVADPTTLMGDSSEGLVSVGPGNISRIRGWCEGEAEMRLESRTASNWCLWDYETLDDVEDDMRDAGYDEDEISEALASVPKVPGCDGMAWDDLVGVQRAYVAAIASGVGYVELPDGTYAKAIEG